MNLPCYHNIRSATLRMSEKKLRNKNYIPANTGCTSPNTKTNTDIPGHLLDLSVTTGAYEPFVLPLEFSPDTFNTDLRKERIQSV